MSLIVIPKPGAHKKLHFMCQYMGIIPNYHYTKHNCFCSIKGKMGRWGGVYVS